MDRSRRRKPLLLRLYRRYLDTEDVGMYRRRVAARYNQGTLERLAEHPSAEVRRAAVAALGLLGDYSANHTLGRALIDPDRTVRILAQHSIQTVWTRDGSPRQRKHLKRIIRLNAARQYPEAIEEATALIEQAPWLAEAWNQRAAAHFALKQFAESIRDGNQALEVNPYHFPAAARMGYAYAELDNPAAALECFRRAIRLNPDMDRIRAEIRRLSRSLGEP